jgi:hypothetical protein
MRNTATLEEFTGAAAAVVKRLHQPVAEGTGEVSGSVVVDAVTPFHRTRPP